MLLDLTARSPRHYDQKDPMTNRKITRADRLAWRMPAPFRLAQIRARLRDSRFLPRPSAIAADSADPARYIADVKALTTPAMEGRGAGTKGIVRASDMIEQRYRSLGLQPAGAKGYFQPFNGDHRSEVKGNQSPGSGKRRIQTAN